MWPFRRHPSKIKESQQAILDATATLQRVQERGPEVRAVSKTLKEIRERNHFADQLRTIMEGR
jgi:hypothetical protein